jgi:hypothetical protein
MIHRNGYGCRWSRDSLCMILCPAEMASTPPTVGQCTASHRTHRIEHIASQTTQSNYLFRSQALDKRCFTGSLFSDHQQSHAGPSCRTIFQCCQIRLELRPRVAKHGWNQIHGIAIENHTLELLAVGQRCWKCLQSVVAQIQHTNVIQHLRQVRVQNLETQTRQIDGAFGVCVLDDGTQRRQIAIAACDSNGTSSVELIASNMHAYSKQLSVAHHHTIIDACYDAMHTKSLTRKSAPAATSTANNSPLKLRKHERNSGVS